MTEVKGVTGWRSQWTLAVQYGPLHCQLCRYHAVQNSKVDTSGYCKAGHRTVLGVRNNNMLESERKYIRIVIGNQTAKLLFKFQK